jgi:hypothetical protein
MSRKPEPSSRTAAISLPAASAHSNPPCLKATTLACGTTASFAGAKKRVIDCFDQNSEMSHERRVMSLFCAYCKARNLMTNFPKISSTRLEDLCPPEADHFQKGLSASPHQWPSQDPQICGFVTKASHELPRH